MSTLDGTLDTFITTKSLRPEPIASQEVRDRGSIFIGNICRATTLEDVKAQINHLKYYVHRQRKATHEIAAWRLMVLKAGKTGLDGPDDFELTQGSKDDGESWAGSKILKVMQNMAVIDAVVIVSRWCVLLIIYLFWFHEFLSLIEYILDHRYGGTLLGPARFSHIETCAMEVCKAFKQTEELQDCLTSLRMLDDMLSGLRKTLADFDVEREARAVADPSLTTSTTSASSESQSYTAGSKEGAEILIASMKSRLPDYNNLDITKAKRLVKARESSIQSVKALIERKKGQMCA